MFDTHEKFELDLNIDGNDDQEEVVSILKQKTKYSIGDHAKTNFTQSKHKLTISQKMGGIKKSRI